MAVGFQFVHRKNTPPLKSSYGWVFTLALQVHEKEAPPMKNQMIFQRYEFKYLMDTCLTAQDNYKRVLDYFKIKYWRVVLLVFGRTCIVLVRFFADIASVSCKIIVSMPALTRKANAIPLRAFGLNYWRICRWKSCALTICGLFVTFFIKKGKIFAGLRINY